MRKFDIPKPSALAVGAISDGKRMFFLVKKNHMGIDCVELPSVLLHGNDDPVSALVNEFSKSCGIDAHVKGVIAQGTHNVGSRKKKHSIPVLVFDVETKIAKPVLAQGISGYKWLTIDEARAMRPTRLFEWIRGGWTE